MKRLIVILHGEYNGDLELSGYGKEQMRQLAEKIRPELTEGKSPFILASTAPRAYQSAEVLASIFGTTIEPHEVLWSDNDHEEDFDAVLKLVKERQDEADVLILVTHKEYGEDFPNFFAIRELNIAVVGRMYPGYAEGCVINLESKAVRIISHVSD